MMTKYERRKALAGVPSEGVELFLQHQEERIEAHEREAMENAIEINGKMYDKRYVSESKDDERQKAKLEG